MHLSYFGVAAALLASVNAQEVAKPGATPLYKNPKAKIEDRIADLLPRMTLEEKVAQLIQGMH